MTSPTVDQVLDTYLDVRGRTVTEPDDLRYATTNLRRLMGGRTAAEVDQAAVDEFIAARAAEGRATGTIRRELTVLMSALRMAHKDGSIPPVAAITLPPAGKARQRFLTPEEAQRLLAAARDPRLRLFIAIALATGARRQAICELTWDRVDLGRGTLDFRAPHPRAARRKGRAVVPIGETLAEMLAVVRPADGRGSVVRIKPAAVWWQFRRAAQRAGLGPEVTPHVLRHTAASIMVKSVPLIVASRMLSHANTSITESVYVHLVADDLRPAAEATGALLGAAARPPAEATAQNAWRRLFGRLGFRRR